MPFYPKLKFGSRTSEELKLKKIRTSTRLQNLKAALRQHFIDSNSTIDSKDSVKIATWNLREFGSGKYKGRDFEALYYIAEIISHFDIITLQEVRSNLKEFDKLKRLLGPDWDYIATDTTDGSSGNDERMVFVFNQRKVQFTNIAGELTLPKGEKIRAAFGERIKLEHGINVVLPAGTPDLSGIYDARIKTTSSGNKKLAADLEIPLPENSKIELPLGSKLVIKKNTKITSPSRGKAKVTVPLNNIKGKDFGVRMPENTFDDSFKQFARTPFLISFQSGWLKLNLCTVHIYYGDATDEGKLEQRRSEISALTASLAAKAKGEFKYNDKTFMGVLGDFNILGKGHPTMEALESNDFLIPDQLKSIPGSNVARNKAYDQIAFWKPSRIAGYMRLDIIAANIFDYYEHVFKTEDEPIYRNESGNGLKSTSRFDTWRTYKMSDHLPMWIELKTDFSNEYLKQISEED
jgi:hypothetical protein